MEDETSIEDCQEEIAKNCKTLKDLRKNHDPFCAICKDPAKNSPKTEEEELFHSALFKNKKFVNALQKIEFDPSCEGCFDQKMRDESHLENRSNPEFYPKVDHDQFCRMSREPEEREEK